MRVATVLALVAAVVSVGVWASSEPPHTPSVSTASPVTTARAMPTLSHARAMPTLSPAARSRAVEASTFGAPWPFIASRAELTCDAGVTTVRLNGGQRFALNRSAELAGWPPLEGYAFLAANSGQHLAALIAASERLC